MRMSRGEQVLIGLIAVLLCVFAVVMLTAGEPRCKPFARWERAAGSMAAYPEPVRGDGEEVTLYVCPDGTVRATVQPFGVHLRYEQHEVPRFDR